MKISIFIDLAVQQVSIETESDLGEVMQEDIALNSAGPVGPDEDGFYPLIDTTQEATHG